MPKRQVIFFWCSLVQCDSFDAVIKPNLLRELMEIHEQDRGEYSQITRNGIWVLIHMLWGREKIIPPSRTLDYNWLHTNFRLEPMSRLHGIRLKSCATCFRLKFTAEKVDMGIYLCYYPNEATGCATGCPLAVNGFFLQQIYC